MSDADVADPTGGRRGERRLLPSLVVLLLTALPFALPSHLGVAPYVLPAITIPLLIAVLVADPGRIDRRTRLLHLLTRALTIVLLLAAAFATARLVAELLRGVPEMRNANALLLTGFLVWIDANLTFALLYWEFDGGGPADRLLAPHPYPDFAFPEHLNPELARPGWMPTFVDYLYVGLTNALAFSPTDVMPLAHWAKLTMALQSIISIAILSLVIANAVNVLS